MNQKFVAPNDPILNKAAQYVSRDAITKDETKHNIEALTPEGRLIEEMHQGYVARILQHEIDHLISNSIG
jgi:hypothetical protein